MGLFKRCIDVLRSFLEYQKIPTQSIDDVVIIGGSSRIPRIQKMLSDFFGGKPLCKNVDPDNAVALGAASLAYYAQNVSVPNILLQDNVFISPSKYGEPTHVKSMIPFASTEKQNIGIYITANTFQVGMCQESNVQSFTKLIAIPPAVYFADEEILIGAKAQEFSSSALSYIKKRVFDIFELINAAPKAKTHRLNIQGTEFTLCTAHIIAAFLHQVFNMLNISRDAKIIVTLPFGKTYPGVDKIRKSLTILGYFKIRILPSLATTAVATLDTLVYYKNGENEAPFRKYIFVLDIQIDSFSMAILEILHKRISVISSRHSESFAACQTERFAQCHADWYKGVEILQGWKDYIQSVYESLIYPFSTISLKAYVKIDAVVINGSECSTSLVRMVKKVLGGKNLKIQQICTSSLLGASLLASLLSRVKSMEDPHILDTNMEVDMTGLISKSLVLTTNIEGQQVIIDNFTRQKFKISTDVTPTSKEKMEPKHLYVLLQNKSNRVDGDMVTSDAGYYQCTVKKNRAKRQLPVSKSIEFEIISKEDLDGFFSLNVVNKSDPDFEILLTKKENLVCNSVCVSPAFSEFGRLIAFYERDEAKTIRELFSSETKTDLAKIKTKTTINPVLPTMHGDK